MMNKQELKSLRDICFEQWSFTSHQAPSWLLKIKPSLMTLCKHQPVHGLFHHWLPNIIALRNTIQQNPTARTELKTSSKAVTGAFQPNQDMKKKDTLNHSTLDHSTATALTQEQLLAHLKKLKPWRKGPWAINDICVQSEWDSSIKYQRLRDYGPCLQHKTVLDIGCGNGYYGYRMLGDGADYVLGVDPSPLFWAQFSTFKAFEPQAAIDLLPIAGEPLAKFNLHFDIVLSMGVLYHRRNPLDHIKLLKQSLATGGELVLETLIIDGRDNQLLMPEKTYAGMPNIWGLPSLGLLTQWLQSCGFKNVRCVSLSLTNFDEQQKTDWVDTHSLENFLSPCGTKTKEGYPAPWRVIMRAEK